MRHQQVALNTLNTPADHLEAIEAIERSPHNSTGDWRGCGETTLKPAAVKKIAAIWVRFDRLFPDTDEG